MVCDTLTNKRPSAVGGVTGAVVGMVAITPASGYIMPGYSIIFGIVGVFCCFGAIKFKKFLRVDDALDVFFCHGIGENNNAVWYNQFNAGLQEVL